MRQCAVLLLAALVLSAAVGARTVPAPTIDVVRVPNAGVQPDAAVDRSGTVHLVYLAGDPAAADVYYVRSTDGGLTFSAPIRVNSQPGSAVATGTIRGAQIAVSASGRIHVAWNGSDRAEPKPPADPAGGRSGSPMLYARSSPQGTAFEPQRNLITQTADLDGGGSVAADGSGRVVVAWHASPLAGPHGEAARRVWLATSRDDGATFEQERPVSPPATGACGCCALRVAAAGTTLRILYRSAIGAVHRDIQELLSHDGGETFTIARLDGWDIEACPMTSMSIGEGATPAEAWETAGNVFMARPGERPAAPPSRADRATRKHPRVATAVDGTTLLVWTEGTAWARGGSIAWQAFDAEHRPTRTSGTRPGLPTWSFATVVPRQTDGFTILY